MRELFTTLFVFAAAFMLWRAIRPHHSHLGLVHSEEPTQQFPIDDEATFKWPALGKFDFAVIDAESHQGALKRAAATAPTGAKGKQCLATLHMGGSQPHVYKPVEVRVQGQRVAFLSSGDASRFQRRLAYEGRAGQTTACEALLVETVSGGRIHYDIRLDLKEFRH
ncbi:hypothetical protein RD110_19495 [Rhodoferax koreense]|uniref:Uncharacterized protein n=1 Tax=Rhodoferax koreensis TaxID=1842727 RepID=A0A1P8JZE3_9BURK|nr:hypothetical protein [Rhodoferax koreense]APW39126.1 hypothetical protein RD110_19495 [Rhodoferax koreense]